MTRPVILPELDRTEQRPWLAATMARHVQGHGPIEDIERRPIAYGSTHPVQELEARFADGLIVRAVLKDLSPGAILRAARSATPSFMVDPAREIEVYRALLPSVEEVAVLYGSAVDRDAGRFWLLLERVPGPHLTEVGDVATWHEAARWLARFHGRWQEIDRRCTDRLIRYDGRFFRRWAARARRFVRRRPVEARALAAFDRLTARYDAVVEGLLALPSVIVHGDFHPGNLLVPVGPPGRRICPVDWEAAGLGPGLVDLAALASGSWSEEGRRGITEAYRDELGRWGASPPPDAFARSLDLCRLHLAVQHVGWSPTWLPPPHQAHDWVGEAVALADRMDL